MGKISHFLKNRRFMLAYSSLWLVLTAFLALSAFDRVSHRQTLETLNSLNQQQVKIQDAILALGQIQNTQPSPTRLYWTERAQTALEQASIAPIGPLTDPATIQHALTETLPAANKRIVEKKKSLKESALDQDTIMHNTMLLLLCVSIIALGGLYIDRYPNAAYGHTPPEDDEQKADSPSANVSDRFLMAAEGSGIGVWDWDLLHNRLWWSHGLKTMIGVEDSAFTPHLVEFESRLHPQDHDRVMALVRDHLQKNTPFDCDYRIRTEGGAYIWFRARGTALRDADGKPYRMLGTMDEVTTRKRLEINNTLFRTGIEAGGLCVAIMDMSDPHWSFSYISPALCALSGYAQDKLLASNINVFNGPETSMSDLVAIENAIRHGQPLKLKLWMYRHDGSRFLSRLSMVPIQGENGELKAFVCLINDLTQDIKREAQQVARQRMESLGSLSSAVAHEINNLMVPMLMAYDLVEPALKEQGTEDAREHLALVKEYADQARTIVKGILTFTRKDTGDIIECDIQNVVTESLRFIRGLVNSEVSLDFKKNTADILKADINPTELRQVMTNLVANAEYALRQNEGARHIHVSMERRTLTPQMKEELGLNDAEQAVISVEDNGPGIPPDVLPRIFEPLFTTKPLGEGTGLGLSVVHGILRSWGGTITVDSAAGKGTRFDIYIPLTLEGEDFSDLVDLAEPAGAVLMDIDSRVS